MNIIESVDPNEVYDRIKNNKPFGKNMKLYPKGLIIKIIGLLEENEEYEKCSYLKRFIKERYNHDYNFKV